MSQGLLSPSPGSKSSTAISSGAVGGDLTYIAGVHFTVTRIDAETLEFAGLGFDPAPNNFKVVSDFTSAKLFTAQYTPRTHVFEWDGTLNRLTVTNAAFSASGSWYIEVIGPDRFASLPDNVKNMAVANWYQLNGDDSGNELITSAQDFTAGWVDLGSEIAFFGDNRMKLWPTIDVNDSTDLQIRVIEKHESGGVEEYIPVIEAYSTNDIKIESGYWEWNVDADALNSIVYRGDGITPYLQVQIKAGVLGVGTDAQMLAAYFTRGTIAG